MRSGVLPILSVRVGNALVKGDDSIFLAPGEELHGGDDLLVCFPDDPDGGRANELGAADGGVGSARGILDEVIDGFVEGLDSVRPDPEGGVVFEQVTELEEALHVNE
jgi:hypothetical protein